MVIVVEDSGFFLFSGNLPNVNAVFLGSCLGSAGEEGIKYVLDHLLLL